MVLQKQTARKSTGSRFPRKLPMNQLDDESDSEVEELPIFSWKYACTSKHPLGRIHGHPPPEPYAPVKRRRTSWFNTPMVHPYSGSRPHLQAQSELLSMPPEIVDKILGDPVLNARDHLALSGTCTAIRLGYNEEIWKPMAQGKVPFSHNVFTYHLLHDPCNAYASRQIHPEVTPAPAIARIWTNAIAASRREDVKPGIDFQAPCYKAKHKKCKCLRFMGQSHSQVISNVNLHKTTWGHVYYHYQDLAEKISPDDFTRIDKSTPKGERADMFRLAAVDAAILEAVGGVTNALRIQVAREGKKRKKLPKD